MREKLIKLLEENARLTDGELAVMLGTTPEAVVEEIGKLESEGVVRGYKALVDWSEIDESRVTALIELRVSPKRDAGFDEIAKKIMIIPEVETVFLMSGGYDLCVIVKGRSFQEVALFVAKRLSTLDSVLSTATHFVLRRYKELGVEMFGRDGDDRGRISL